MAWRDYRRGLLASVGLLATACPPKAPPTPRAPALQVRSFTEAGSVTDVAVVGAVAYVVGDRGATRWDLDSGRSEQLDLFGQSVRSLSVSPARTTLWMTTGASSVVAYDVASGVLDVMPEPDPGTPALLATAGAVAVAASEGGAWVGGPSGLAFVSDDGAWADGIVNRPVTAARVYGGELWLATGDGSGLAIVPADPDRPAGREAVAEADAGGDGCANLGRSLMTVTALGEAPTGEPLVVGEDGRGRQRILLRHDGRCRLYRVAPTERWIAVARRPGDTVVMTGRRLYSLSVGRRGARRLRRDGMSLVGIARGEGGVRPANPFVIRTLDARPPPGASALAASDAELLIGTERLGAARLRPRSAGPRQWLRTHELADGGERLSVACTSRTACFVGTGGRRGWRFDGESFRALGAPDARVFSVTRRADDEVYAVYRDGEEPRVRLARLVADATGRPPSPPGDADPPAVDWSPVEGVLVETPGVSDVTVARISPSGAAWIGLRYRDADGDLVNFGVAEVDLGLGVVAYHHASRSERVRRRGVLPIPLSISDLDFLGDDEVWLASNQGATRIAGRDVSVFGEAEGLLGEVLRGIAVNSGGTVFVASREGIGVYDGERWSYPRPLRRRASALAIGKNGRLWMATPRGLAVYDGAQVRRIGRRRGLLSDDVLDVEVDAFGRVWALTAEGIDIVTLR